MKSLTFAPFNLKSVFFNFPAVAMALMVAALVSLWFAGSTAKSFAAAFRTQSIIAPESSSLIKLNKKPASDADITALIATIKQNHSGLDVSASAAPGSIVISAANQSAYRDWIAAFGTIQGASKPGSVWLATEICVGKCGELAMRAQVQGLTQSITQSGPKETSKPANAKGSTTPP